MKVHLRMLGCRLNQAEIEQMARQFEAQGHEIVAAASQADEVVVNTCAVTQDASKSSRQLIRQMYRENPQAQITATGCYSQIEPSVVQALPGVHRVIDNAAKDRLVESVTGTPLAPFEVEPIVRDAAVRAGRTRAFVKVQDGCANACTFCITTVARGEGRSRPLDEVVSEVRLLLALGYQEIVLTGVHLGSYGHDLGRPDGLSELVRTLLNDTDAARLRLSSLEPWDLEPEFFDLWTHPRICRHLHLPLQSGCNATLKRMLRRTTQAQFRELVAAARERVPDLCITSDVIVGFPGETEDEFAISSAFIEAMDFAGLHVFRYSKRAGTAAARMRQQIDEDTKRQRSAQLIAYSEAQERRYAERFAGQSLPVLWEQVAGVTERGFINVGYTDNYIRVRCEHPRPFTNEVFAARLETFDPIGRYMQVLPLLS